MIDILFEILALVISVILGVITIYGIRLYLEICTEFDISYSEIGQGWDRASRRFGCVIGRTDQGTGLPSSLTSVYFQPCPLGVTLWNFQRRSSFIVASTPILVVIPSRLRGSSVLPRTFG